MVEFALSIMIFFFVVLWLFELILMMYTYNVMADAAKEGVRYATVHGSYNSSPSGPSSGSSVCYTTSSQGTATAVFTQIQQFANLSLHDITGMTANVCYLDGSNKPPNRVQVKVSYPLVPYFALPWTPPTINAVAQGNIVN